MKKVLSAKEALFCEYYKILRSPREAAARAGFPFPEKSGLRLLKKDAVLKEIKAANTPPAEAVDGFSRIAFGSICDAVRLCLNTEGFSQEELEKLDLYSVSELKFNKNGTIEIKFFDRLKALERLCEISERSDASAAPFYEALAQGARGLEGGNANGV